MKFMKKRGGILLEAAFVYPLLFLCMTAVICIIISMYIASVSKAGLDIRLMEENLKQNQLGSMNIEHTNKFNQDKYSFSTFLKGENIIKGSSGGIAVFEGVKESEYSMYGISIQKIRKTQKSRLYDLDEKKYIRKCDMVL